MVSSDAFKLEDLWHLAQLSADQLRHAIATARLRSNEGGGGVESLEGERGSDVCAGGLKTGPIKKTFGSYVSEAYKQDSLASAVFCTHAVSSARTRRVGNFQRGFAKKT